MKNQWLKSISGLSLLLLVTFTGCKKEDDPKTINSEEEITTVTLTLTKAGSTTPVTITYEDLDGDGGNAPTFTPVKLTLDATATYTAKVTFLNKNLKPTEEGYDVTEEVEGDESVEHEVYMIPTTATLTISDRNKDKNGKPLGTQATLKTGTASSGTLTLTLKHKPLESNSPKTDTDPITKGGTDVEVPFPVEVK